MTQKRSFGSLQWVVYFWRFWKHFRVYSVEFNLILCDYQNFHMHWSVACPFDLNTIITQYYGFWRIGYKLDIHKQVCLPVVLVIFTWNKSSLIKFISAARKNKIFKIYSHTRQIKVTLSWNKYYYIGFTLPHVSNLFNSFIYPVPLSTLIFIPEANILLSKYENYNELRQLIKPSSKLGLPVKNVSHLRELKLFQIENAFAWQKAA